MKINIDAIQGYADMTAEQKIAALEAFEFDDKSGEVEKLKNAVSKANSEAADWKKKHNALLSEDEQKKQKDAETLSEMQKELETLRKDKTVSEYTAKYLSLGYAADLAAETAKAMAEGDTATVFANGEKHKAALEQKIREDLMNGTPKPKGSGGKDSANPYEEQAKAIGKQRAEADKAAADVMKHYIK